MNRTMILPSNDLGSGFALPVLVELGQYQAMMSQPNQGIIYSRSAHKVLPSVSSSDEVIL